MNNFERNHPTKWVFRLFKKIILLKSPHISLTERHSIFNLQVEPPHSYQCLCQRIPLPFFLEIVELERVIRYPPDTSQISRNRVRDLLKQLALLLKQAGNNSV